MLKISLHITTVMLVLIVSTIPVALAEDCLHDPIYDRNWNAEVTTGVRLRSIPCMETSEVLATLPVGEVVNVIAETDGYYQIKRADGQEGWVGQWLITRTDKPFSMSTEQPETSPETCSTTLCDVTGHKNEYAIRELYAHGIISGHPDGSFKPDDPLNRAELVKLLVEARYKEFDSIKGSYSNSCFPDTPASEWYTPYICYAQEKEIIDGYPDGTFRPGQSMNKVEALKVILNTFDWEIPAPPYDFSYSDTSTDQWYAGYLQVANENEILEENNGAFHPSNAILRGGVSHIIYETLLLEPEEYLNEPTI